MFEIPDLQMLLTQFGYLAVFAGMFLEGEAVVLAAALLAQQGYLGIEGVIAASALGAMAADNVLFGLGRKGGRAVLRDRPRLDAGFDRAAALVRRNPTLAVLSMRFLYGTRFVTPVAIGASGLSPLRFAGLNALAAGCWAVGVGVAGYAFAGIAREVVTTLDTWALPTVATLISLALAFWGTRRWLIDS